MLTIPQVRELLGDAAIGRSDEDLTRLRDQYATFARALLSVSASQKNPNDSERATSPRATLRGGVS